MKKPLFSAILLFSGLFATAQQDAQFSQYIFNTIYINPAYAGHRQELNVNAFYRNQWTGVKGAPRTMSAAVDGSVKDERVGLALLLLQDKIGAQNKLAVYGNYAYRIPFENEGTLALGVGAGFIQMGIDGSVMNPNDPDDPYVPVGRVSSMTFDARAGAYYSKEKFFIGFSADNLVASHLKKNKPKSIDAVTPKPHFYLTGGALFQLTETVYFKPLMLLKDDSGGPTSLDLNSFLLFNEVIWIGGGYRTGINLYKKNNLQSGMLKRSAITGMVDVFATPQFRIGYAYDHTLNALQGYSGGSHEISFSYYFKNENRRNPMLRQARCFKF